MADPGVAWKPYSGVPHSWVTVWRQGVVAVTPLGFQCMLEMARTLQFRVFNFSNSPGRLGQWNVEISSNPKPPRSVTLQTQSCASNRELKTLFSHFTSDQRKCGMLALALNFNQFNSKYMKSKYIFRTSERVTKCLTSSTPFW